MVHDVCVETARLYLSRAYTPQPAFALCDDTACLFFHMLGQESQSAKQATASVILTLLVCML